ncbi:LLM class flavin-dependent oxidoreductase [Streptomyces mangrovisoli]|uniref:Alkanesulfonate monooxygenase n=1 Tax=Streptomyces mangrovisoli TaxID=1428628 RepID=A0A1J4NKT9_9ACTN|nr:LLM class flavin-dependent oxidoreductase [Streptomyces mangrovisoli]OIJ62778.1 alkanesulfonate monooxygenase [Streptomyces mangrovisoli]
MSVEFIGMIGAKDSDSAAPGPAVDPEFTLRFARVHEEAGFDRVLIGHSSSSPDGAQLAAYVAARTERLGLLLAHRPGAVFPTMAARTFATLDHLSAGRLAVHVISGGNDAEQRRDGDYLNKDDRYARTDEFLEVVKRAWSEPEGFGHEGRFYRFDDFRSEVRPLQQPRVPLYFGGSSAAALRVGGRHADVFALWGEPLAETAEQIAAVRAAARAAGRTEPPGISVSFRPVLGRTEEEAWRRAHGVLDAIRSRGTAGSFFDRGRPPLPLGPSARPENTGSQRLLAAAAKGELHDRALWTAPAAATGAAGNSTALVGTPETVAQALLDYVDIGVTTFLLRGYEPVRDAAEFGRTLLPMVREEAARRARTAMSAGAAGATG